MLAVLIDVEMRSDSLSAYPDDNKHFEMSSDPIHCRWRISNRVATKFISTFTMSARGDRVTSAYQKGFVRGQALALIRCGRSVSEVSSELNVPQRTIYFWLQRGCDKPDGKSTGRSRVTSRRTDRLITRIVHVDPSVSLSEISAETNLSRASCWRRLKEADFVSRKRPSSLHLSDRHKTLRLQWAMKHCHWRNQWARVVWSDEAAVRLRFKDGRLKLWIKSGRKIPGRFFTSRRQDDGRKLLIWGAIWSDGRTSLHVMRENMNSERYIQVLESHVYPLAFSLGDPSSEWILMDDNAPPHRAETTRLYKRSAGIRTLDWPARSPDLNPIEHVWAILKRHVRRHLCPSDGLDRLESLIKEEWDRVDQQVIKNLICSMSARVRKVIERRGDESGY